MQSSARLAPQAPETAPIQNLTESNDRASDSALESFEQQLAEGYLANNEVARKICAEFSSASLESLRGQTGASRE